MHKLRVRTAVLMLELRQFLGNVATRALLP